MKIEVTSDGAGLVSHAGSALLALVADKSGLTRALSRGLGPLQLRAGSHDRGRVVRDLAVIARRRRGLLGRHGCGPRSGRTVLCHGVGLDGVSGDRSDRQHAEAIDWLRDAHARARACVWELAGAAQHLTIDLDATLLTAHSEKEGAEPTWKRGYGFHPMVAYADETGEALAGELRPGNAGAGTAADQIAVAEAALAQIPAAHIKDWVCAL